MKEIKAYVSAMDMNTSFSSRMIHHHISDSVHDLLHFLGIITGELNNETRMLRSTRSVWADFTADHREIDVIVRRLERVQDLNNQTSIKEMTLRKKK
jgi:hypothetical protein